MSNWNRRWPCLLVLELCPWWCRTTLAAVRFAENPWRCRVHDIALRGCCAVQAIRLIKTLPCLLLSYCEWLREHLREHTVEHSKRTWKEHGKGSVSGEFCSDKAAIIFTSSASTSFTGVMHSVCTELSACGLIIQTGKQDTTSVSVCWAQVFCNASNVRSSDLSLAVQSMCFLFQPKLRYIHNTS